MTLVLPTTVHNKRTRVGGEVLVYYNLGVGKKIGSLAVGASAVEKTAEATCTDEATCPTSGFAAAVIRVPNEVAIIVTGGGTFPIKSPIGAAIEIDQESVAYSSDIEDYDINNNASPGDQVDIICLPNPLDDKLVCFENGFSATAGTTQRPVARKFNVADHYVRQRPENAITLTDILVSAWDGLQRLNGLEVTLIAKLFPDGGAVPSQVMYYSGVKLNMPQLASPGEANESIEHSAEGSFNHVAIFAAQP